jgi:hypothetical protein
MITTSAFKAHYPCDAERFNPALVSIPQAA